MYHCPRFQNGPPRPRYGIKESISEFAISVSDYDDILSSLLGDLFFWSQGSGPFIWPYMGIALMGPRSTSLREKEPRENEAHLTLVSPNGVLQAYSSLNP